MDLANFDSIISGQANMWSDTFADLERRNRETLAAVEEANAHKRAAEDAQIKNAQHTAEINIKVDKIIQNQQELIDYQRGQIKFQEEQLQILKNIFASGEDGVAVQKEIMKTLEDNLGKDHPLLSYFADKGGDIAFPALFAALKVYLVSKGMLI